MSATLALPGGTLSHRAGGDLWRMLDSELLEVTVPSGGGYRSRDGILVHRATLPEADVCRIRGIRVTTLPRTILDLAAVLPLRPLEDAFEEAQVRHRLQPVVIGERVLLRGGFRGSAKLRSILAGAVDPGLVQSRLELHFFKLCNDHGIPRPLTNVGIGPWNVDFLWPDALLVVETDSKRWHSTPRAKRRDAEKQAWLEARGYRVLRFRWADVHARARWVADAIAVSCGFSVIVTENPQVTV